MCCFIPAYSSIFFSRESEIFRWNDFSIPFSLLFEFSIPFSLLLSFLFFFFFFFFYMFFIFILFSTLSSYKKKDHNFFQLILSIMIKFKYLLTAVTFLLLFLNFLSYKKEISHSLVNNENVVEEKIDPIDELTSLWKNMGQAELEEKLKDFREAIHSGEATSRSKFQLDSDEKMLLEFASRQQKQKQQQQQQQQPELVSNLDRCVWSGSGVNQAEGNKRKMFIRTVALFNALNITYVLSSGSLLGALRESGGIKWDGDMDIVIPVIK